MLTVIICTYNRDKYIGQLLESIAKNSLPKSEYEILLVDNNCTDNTRKICEDFVSLHKKISFRYVVETEQGLSAARNCGLKNAKGELVVFVDDDAFVDENYLSEYVDFFDKHPDVMALGGPIEPFYETQEPKWMSQYTKALLTGWMNYGNQARLYPRGRYPGGGNAAYRKLIFDKVGYFNTELGRKGNLLLSSEEKDIFDKMNSIGMKVMYIPKPVLHHCIPQAKLENDYFNRLTLQIGKSERIRTLAIGKLKYFKRLFLEIIKWGGTIVLLCAYFIRGNFMKGWKLVIFRKNVTKGLILD